MFTSYIAPGDHGGNECLCFHVAYPDPYACAYIHSHVHTYTFAHCNAKPDSYSQSNADTDGHPHSSSMVGQGRIAFAQSGGSSGTGGLALVRE